MTIRQISHLIPQGSTVKQNFIESLVLFLSSILCTLTTEEPQATFLSFESDHTALGEEEH